MIDDPFSVDTRTTVKPALFLIGLSCMLLSCSGRFDQSRSYLEWEPVQNEYATCFRVLRNNGQQLLIIHGPGATSDTTGIYLIGDAAVDGLDPLPSLQRIIAGTTTHLPFFTILGRENIIVGAVHLRDVFDHRIKALAGQGSIKEVGTADGIDHELITSLAPQAMFDHPFGKNVRTGNNALPVIYITEYLEEHPLGRAEWIKVFGLLTGEEQRADKLFQEIRDRYRMVAESAADLDKKPAVFFGSSWEGQWFAPPANSYMAQLIKDAGGEYSFADQASRGNLMIDLESVLHKVRRAQHFGMILHSWDSITALALAGGETRLEKIPAVEAGGFYGNTFTSDLFGQAVLEPDVVLMDLMNIFHRDSLDTSGNR
ncbi:MAG: ABC transporter substrate-binding protein, partial [Bacteroidota bacterium]|nr:ABC transporter substrate-binding protein [Bacteroidota bacterium]